MIIELEPLPFIQSYLMLLDQRLQQQGKNYRLSTAQKAWLGFCLMAILLTNSICWERFERMSLKSYSKALLSWLLRHSKIAWDRLLMESTMMILERHGIYEGILVVDDKDIDRSKHTSRIDGVHKVKDKGTGGYKMAQTVVFLYLVTKKFSIPVGFAFYKPDPKWSEWLANDKRLRKQKIPKKERPEEPERNWKKKHELALELMQKFKENIPTFNVVAVMADALYGHAEFINGVLELWKETQVISQLRKNQKVCCGKRRVTCREYFESYRGWEQEIKIRGRKLQTVLAGGGRLHVPSHKQKRFVIGLKYDGENEYRYLLAANLSWNMKHVMEAYSFRWLVEVFLEDWACYGGFCSLAKQRDIEGSERPLILSLLFDHCFLFHPEQILSIEKQASLATFGSLLERSRMEAFIKLVQHILEEKEPQERFDSIVREMSNVFCLRPSEKHLNGIEILWGPIHKAEKYKYTCQEVKT
jgi:hypothetical protein